MKKKLKIVLTATGAPGCSTLIRKIKNNGEREVEVVGVDAHSDVIGQFLSDKFYQVPQADSPEYIPAIKDILDRENPDLFFPVSSAEVLPVSKHKGILEATGCKVMVSDHSAIKTAENKYEVYKLLKQNGIDVPRFRNPTNLREFTSMARELGYPKQRVCFKPHVGKGSRGFRILDDEISRKDLLLNYKPESRYMSLDEFIKIFEQEEDFPTLLLMQMVEGQEFDAMSLCMAGEELLTTVKTREENRWGIITLGELVDKPEIVDSVNKILALIPLSYNISLQFIGTRLIEINPRTSTYIYQDDLNEPYLSIKLCLGEEDKESIRRHRENIRFGRRMIRYMDQIFWDKGSTSHDN
jgi:carbamoylphosphate synthase large subunit